jgi:hypothetical protein
MVRSSTSAPFLATVTRIAPRPEMPGARRADSRVRGLDRPLGSAAEPTAGAIGKRRISSNRPRVWSASGPRADAKSGEMTCDDENPLPLAYVAYRPQNVCRAGSAERSYKPGVAGALRAEVPLSVQANEQRAHVAGRGADMLDEAYDPIKACSATAPTDIRNSAFIAAILRGWLRLGHFI